MNKVYTGFKECTTPATILILKYSKRLEEQTLNALNRAITFSTVSNVCDGMAKFKLKVCMWFFTETR